MTEINCYFYTNARDCMLFRNMSGIQYQTVI
jgi:hypothetical protein